MPSVLSLISQCKRPSTLITGLAALILATGLFLFFIGSRPPPSPKFVGSLKELLPTEHDVPGWQVEWQAIASTPELKAKVGELLNYSDGVYVIYRRGGQHFSVYIAYWTPGRMSHRLVAGHTPDVCWVGAGWATKEAKSEVRLPDSGGQGFLPGERRTMVLNGNTEFLMFWHLLDGTPISYHTNEEPPWYAFLGDIFSRKLNQRGEQFFVRISSNEPTENWSSLDAYLVLVHKLTVLRAP